MKHFMLYGHGGAYNHGAEAIVKTLIEIIRLKYDDAYITLSSHFPEQDMEFYVDADEIIAPDLEAWENEKYAPLDEKEALARIMYASALNTVTSNTTLLSVGGDNFCYPNWHRLKVFQEEAKRKKARSILWGASVELSSITSEMVEVLGSYDVIIARESCTYSALCEQRIASEIVLLPDIAFNLEPEPVTIPSGFEKGRFVGINISPLITGRETVEGIIKQSIIELVRYIINETDYNIALIPHVVMPMDNDHVALSEVQELLNYNHTERIWLVSDRLSAAQYKFIISQCNSLVCSRTHASIAAYTSSIPCGVIGYSVKSVGIAEDLGVQKYLMDVSKIISIHAVRDMYKLLLVDADEIKAHLDEVINHLKKNVKKYYDYI